jgi:hypothetical protein
MLAAITSEMADIVRSRAWNASRRQSRKPFSLTRDQGFESIPLQRRVKCEPDFPSFAIDVIEVTPFGVGYSAILPDDGVLI